jgi:hypothetical protein
MPDVFPNEAFPADAAVALLDGTLDPPTGLPYVAKGVGPASTPSYEIQYNRRQKRQNQRLALVTAGLVVDEGGLKIGVYPFDYRMAGQFRRFDGATQQSVPDNATRYVYVDSANLLQIAATEPADVTAFAPLARVVAVSGQITITPRTNFMRLSVPSLGSSPAGDGLSLSGGALAVNADGTTLETSADALRIKDGGVTAAKLASPLASLVPMLSLSVGPEDSPAADDRIITVQAQDARGVNLAERFLMRIWIGTTQYGAPSGSGQTLAVTTGTVVINGGVRVITDSAGVAAVKINVAAVATRYIMADVGGRIYATGAVTWNAS